MTNEDWATICRDMLFDMIKGDWYLFFDSTPTIPSDSERVNHFNSAYSTCFQDLLSEDKKGIPLYTKALSSKKHLPTSTRNKEFIKYCKRSIRNKRLEGNPRRQLNKALYSRVNTQVSNGALLRKIPENCPFPFLDSHFTPSEYPQWLNERPYAGLVSDIVENVKIDFPPLPKQGNGKCQFSFPLPKTPESQAAFHLVFDQCQQSLFGSQLLDVLGVGFDLYSKLVEESLDEPVGDPASGLTKGDLKVDESGEDPAQQSEKDHLPPVQQTAAMIEETIQKLDKGRGKVEHLFYQGFLWFKFYLIEETQKSYLESDYTRHFQKNSSTINDIHKKIICALQKYMTQIVNSSGVVIPNEENYAHMLEAFTLLRERHIEKKPEFVGEPALGKGNE